MPDGSSIGVGACDEGRDRRANRVLELRLAKPRPCRFSAERGDRDIVISMVVALKRADFDIATDPAFGEPTDVAVRHLHDRYGLRALRSVCLLGIRAVDDLARCQIRRQWHFYSRSFLHHIPYPLHYDWP